MATIINTRNRGMVGIGSARLSPREIGEADMSEAAVKAHPFYLAGWIDLAGSQAPAPAAVESDAEGAPDEEADDGPSDEDVAGIMQILDTDEPDAWSNGKPKTKALTDALGQRVSAEQRDRVWAQVQEG